MLQRTAARPVAVARPTGQAGQCAAITWRGDSGPKPNSGTVGPKIVTVGVPMADARCCGAESLAMSTRQRPRRAAVASGVRSTGRIDDAGAVGAGRGHDLCGLGLLATRADDGDAPLRRVVRP